MCDGLVTVLFGLNNRAVTTGRVTISLGYIALQSCLGFRLLGCF